MKILSFKPGHDGSLALIEEGRLQFSLEAEKDSYPRYSDIHPMLISDAMSMMDDFPDVISISGYSKGFHSNSRSLEAGYFGYDDSKNISRKTKFMGKEIDFFSSTHERSHILAAYGMSDFAQGTPCYVLVWEGNIGSFYEIDENVKVHHIGKVLEDPGNKYAYIYSLADPTVLSTKGKFRFSDAGKLMALTSFSNREPCSKEEQDLIDLILSQKSILLNLDKQQLSDSVIYNSGVESEVFKNFSGNFSDAIFNLFYDFAKKNLKKGFPLLVSGGCGLNCDWNTKWKMSGLFSDVFVIPVPNDAGSAIGTAIDAMLHYTGQAKIKWDVYAGKDFIDDFIPLDGLDVYELDYNQVASFLAEDNVIAWVQGRYEIGPRALGNRSILAAPFKKETQVKLNKIKNREGFRPIAPICAEEDVSNYFYWSGSTPYMLHFQKLKSNKLLAVTHVDDTARVQTVAREQNEKIHNLLMSFKKNTGFSVLCNTSLNFNGTGFINRSSDLLEYAKNHGLDGFVVNDKFYVMKK